MSVIVFGSINTDLAFGVQHLPKPGETVLTPDYQAVAGGKGCNQAVAAAKLGADVRMIGAVGDDPWASIPMAAMEAVGVDTHDVRITDLPTAVAAVMVDAAGQNAIVVASGANADVRADQLDDVRAGDVLLCQMEVPAAETGLALAKAKAAGALTVLNLAPARVLPASALRSVDIWIVNALEAEALAAQIGLAPGVERAEMAKALAARLEATVVVTLGADGAVAASPDGERIVARALPIAVVDTTGAGDAFSGGLAAAMAEGLGLAEAMRWASAAGALACTGFGAQAGLVDRAQILSLRL